MEQSLIRGYPLFCCRSGLLRTTGEFTVIRKVPGAVGETESLNLARMFLRSEGHPANDVTSCFTF